LWWDHIAIGVGACTGEAVLSMGQVPRVASSSGPSLITNSSGKLLFGP
jgi:hypothetical protein